VIQLLTKRMASPVSRPAMTAESFVKDIVHLTFQAPSQQFEQRYSNYSCAVSLDPVDGMPCSIEASSRDRLGCGAGCGACSRGS